jgi:hypothetical protein
MALTGQARLVWKMFTSSLDELVLLFAYLDCSLVDLVNLHWCGACWFFLPSKYPSFCGEILLVDVQLGAVIV